MKIFDEIKEMVTTKQAAELYGIKTVSNGIIYMMNHCYHANDNCFMEKRKE